VAETERTLAELQALLADNTTQDISAQDLRDLMISALGGYASLYVDAGVVAQALTATPALLTAFTAIGPEHGAAAAHAADTITVGVAGNYEVTLTASLTASVSTVLDLALYVGVAAKAGFSARVAAGTSSVGAAFSGLVALAAGDVLKLYTSCAPNASVTIRHAHLAIKRVG
jgi:hypothetical protein